MQRERIVINKMKLSKGIQFFAGSTQTTYDLTNLNLSAGNYAITVVAEAEGFTDSDASNSVNYTVQAQLAAPTIAMNADGKTLEITDVADATSYDVYVDGTLKTNVAYVEPVYTVTFSSDFTIDLTAPVGYGEITGIKYIDVNNTEQILPVNNSNYQSYRNTTFEAKSISDIEGNYEYATITIDGTLYYSQNWGTSGKLPLNLTSNVTITEMFSRG